MINSGHNTYRFGIYGGSENKESGVVLKLSESLTHRHGWVSEAVMNGFKSVDEFPKTLDHNLTLWMIDVDNSEKKSYPIKKKGSVLICSKFMREGMTEIEAISRPV